MAVAERLGEGERGVPGWHPGEQRLKGWQESDQGPPSGHRLFLSAAADKGHFQTVGLLSQAWPFFLSQLHLAGSPVPKPGLFLPPCLRDKGQDKSPYS